MQREQVQELHYIAPLDNLRSIRQHGLLSHNAAKRVPHVSIASLSVQDNRRGKKIPGGRFLHSYVNTYFDARNSMMSKLMFDGVPNLIVVRINSDLLDEPDTVISDGNAATGTTRFFPSPDGLAYLDAERVYAHSWNHRDSWVKAERKRMRSAEVLIPDFVLPDRIIGCYTLTPELASECIETCPGWKVEVKPYVYFR